MIQQASYRRENYANSPTSLRVTEPELLDHGASDALRTKKREWLGFRPIDSQGNIGKLMVVVHGEKRSVSVHPAELFRRILAQKPRGLILVHNHPSGTLEPSQFDFDLTERVDTMARILGIKLQGHFIVTPTSHNLFWQAKGAI